MNDSEKKQSLALAEHYFRSNNYQFAEHILNTIIKIDPNNSKANELLAYIYGNKGDSNTSYQLLEKSCSKEDCSPEALYYLGSAQLKLNLYEKAVGSFKQSIEKAGVFFEALHDLATTYGHLGQTQEALSCYLDCLKLNQNSYELYFNIAKCLDDLKRHLEALNYYDRALQLQPTFTLAWYNKALTLYDLKRFEEALFHYDKAIQLQPTFAEAWSNKGEALKNLKRFDEALSHYDQAIQIKPDLFDSYWNKSLALLTIGNFRDGWDLYSYRWKRNNADKYHHNNIKELESLDNLTNKNILVWHEQGYGDTIQFSRYISKLIDLGANVTFEVQKSLQKLMQANLSCNVIHKTSEENIYDFQIPLLSLPKLFGTRLETIPAIKPVITVATEDIKKWIDKLNLSKSKVNIGLAISGNTNQQTNAERSIPLEKIQPLCKHGNIFLIQNYLLSDDQKYLEEHPEINYLGNYLSDFTDTAEIVGCMDIIISTCTSLVHLAGSMNKKTFLMSRWAPDWRWLLDRDDSPWYPSVKIFRQQSIGNWDSVINQIEVDFIKNQLQASEPKN
ncbi:tetratricopeptide repeat protein [Polynucleobacter victoriensis]|uniref:Tetratricopeptide (TPR) repeat n=1 Tax=Polynucleobacter victoriensis TaxID=2049319 RepID=A0A212T7N3_9BURK|nr:tetratricopeptide repeat protein [Polynucleobacter victoriensis]SNC61851.1 Tetratricopeptide (TPR) repeat [Polynucleobacter victoriensis]